MKIDLIVGLMVGVSFLAPPAAFILTQPVPIAVPAADAAFPGGVFDVPPGMVGLDRPDWTNAGFVPGILRPDSFPYGEMHAVLWNVVSGERTDLEPLIDTDALGFIPLWTRPIGPVASRHIPVYCSSGSGGRTIGVFVAEADWPIDVTTQGVPVGDARYGVPDGIVTGADIQYMSNRYHEESQQ